MEIWKEIPGSEGKYEVSSYGRVRSVDHYAPICYGAKRTVKGRILKPWKQPNGYYAVSLGRKGIVDGEKRRPHYDIHRLVAVTFLPNPENKPDVNHKNLIKTDNRLTNLEWVTTSENLQHAHDNGAFPPEPHRKEIKCVEIGMTFPSSYQAAEWVNECVKQGTGSITCIAGTLRAAHRSGKMRYGYHWSLVDEQPSTTIPKGSTPKRVEMGGSA